MNCVICDICVYHLGLFVFSPRVFLSSRVTGVCPVTTDLITRDNVRTTTISKLGDPFVGEADSKRTVFDNWPGSTFSTYSNTAVVGPAQQQEEELFGLDGCTVYFLSSLHNDGACRLPFFLTSTCYSFWQYSY